MAARRVHDNFIFRDMHDGPMPLDYNFFILKNEFRTVLVDVGFGRRAAKERGKELFFDPIEGLSQMGIDPDSIEDVLITHLHYDHSGNIDRFSKARFHVQDAEVEFATGRCMCDKFTRLPFDVEDIVTLVRHTYADRVRFHDGDAEFRPGITLHALPGHSASVQAVKVSTPRGPILLASDASHYYANVLNRSPFILTLDAPDTLQSYTHMLELSGGVDKLIPGHDPKLRRLYPSVDANGIEIFALHEQPDAQELANLTRVDDFDGLDRE
jgi:glyoxylase-like metal-dependent hydrolase (beta-lactamase superfamily II)